MAAVVADGTIVAIATTYGSSKTMSAVTNANPAVATLESSHGVSVNDIMEMSSGWPDLDDKILRASVVNTNDVTLEGFSTSNTTKFPASSGVGTERSTVAPSGTRPADRWLICTLEPPAEAPAPPTMRLPWARA